jgi:hypothetical protein
MPLLFLFLAGAGTGAFVGAQADDAVETVTGERGGIPYLQLLILGVAAFYIWKFTKGIKA